MANYNMYKFFRGEEKNPFDRDKQNAEFMFWGYEKSFEELFSKGDFNPDSWIPPYSSDIKEWRAVLSQEPVDKEELFKLWIYNLLMNVLPDKYQVESDHFLKMYNK
jgi:hypothetical protein